MTGKDKRVFDCLPYSPMLSYYESGAHALAPYTMRSISLSKVHGLLTNPDFFPLSDVDNNREGLCLHSHSILPSGVFTYPPLDVRLCHDSQITESGLIGLEFHEVSDVQRLRESLLSDSVLSPSIMLLFEQSLLPTDKRSTGLSIIVSTEQRIWRKHNYVRVTDYIKRHHMSWASTLRTETSSMMWSLELAYDPEAYLNPNHRNPLPFPMKRFYEKKRTDYVKRFGEKQWNIYCKHYIRYLHLENLR